MPTTLCIPRWSPIQVLTTLNYYLSTTDLQDYNPITECIQHLLFPGGHPSKYWRGMAWYATQSYYSDTEPPSPCSILKISIAWLGSNKYQIVSHWFDPTTVWTARYGSQTPSLFGHSVWSVDYNSVSRCLQHLVFQSGHPPKYSRGSTIIYPIMLW